MNLGSFLYNGSCENARVQDSSVWRREDLRSEILLDEFEGLEGEMVVVVTLRLDARYVI